MVEPVVLALVRFDRDRQPRQARFAKVRNTRVMSLRPRAADKDVSGIWRTRATSDSCCIVPLPSRTLSGPTSAPQDPDSHHTDPQGLQGSALHADRDAHGASLRRQAGPISLNGSSRRALSFVIGDEVALIPAEWMMCEISTKTMRTPSGSR